MHTGFNSGGFVERMSNRSEAAFYQEIYDLRPWYHDFSGLGLKTVFDEPPGFRSRVSSGLRDLTGMAVRALRASSVEKGEKLSLRGLLISAPSSHLVNQRHKEGVIFDLLGEAIQNTGESPKCLDLFCADGYYSCALAGICPSAEITGVDLDAAEIARAQTASRILEAHQCRFVVADVWDFVSRAEPYDLVTCTGGLYHLSEPRHFLELLYPVCAEWLVVQSVVTLETEDAEYFISPAPGWKHGSRFTHAGLRSWLEETGWVVVKERRNELLGNQRLCDRGSSYFLCRVPHSTNQKRDSRRS
jgi:hypothetical protein